jgi:predicted nucleotidyltransferase
MMKANASLQVLEGKMEELTELCRRFNVRRLEIFASAATEAFRTESSDLDFIVDFSDQPLARKSHKPKRL